MQATLAFTKTKLIWNHKLRYYLFLNDSVLLWYIRFFGAADKVSEWYQFLINNVDVDSLFITACKLFKFDQKRILERRKYLLWSLRRFSSCEKYFALFYALNFGTQQTTTNLRSAFICCYTFYIRRPKMKLLRTVVLRTQNIMIVDLRRLCFQSPY